MSSADILEHISQELKKLLVNSLQDEVADNGISLASPVSLIDNNPANAIELSFYLYQVVPNAHLNNQQLIPAGRGEQHYPPLSLDLFYLLTPLSNTPEKNLRILGKAMQGLAARPMIQAHYLDSELRPDRPEVRVMLNPVNLEELARLWSAFNKDYRLSVCYQVRAVSIDSVRMPEKGPDVTERLLDVHQIVASNGGGR